MRCFTSASTWRHSTHDGWTLKRSNQCVTTEAGTPPTAVGSEDFRSEHGKTADRSADLSLRSLQQHAKTDIIPNQLTTTSKLILYGDIRSTDVVLGRGKDATTGERFEPILSEWWKKYAATTRNEKHSVCRAALKDLYCKGVRFLRRADYEADNESEVVCYYRYLEEPRDSPKTTEKVMRTMRALGRAHTSTSDHDNVLITRPSNPIKPTSHGPEVFRKNNGQYAKNNPGRSLHVTVKGNMKSFEPARTAEQIFKCDVRSTDIVLGYDRLNGDADAPRSFKQKVCRAVIDDLSTTALVSCAKSRKATKFSLWRNRDTLPG
jgi:hypothetical protein